jgi:hypothetical protein
VSDSAEPVTVPMVAAAIDVASFDQKVAELGGTRNALVAALAARLGRALDRVDPDGNVMLTFPVSNRDAVMAPLPLIPYLPKVLVAQVEKAVLQEGLPIGCSNAGDMPPALSRIDGSPADFFIGRMIENGVTEQAFARRGGHLALGVTITDGTAAISIASWKVGGPNTAETLAKAVATAFGDFGLTPDIQW